MSVLFLSSENTINEQEKLLMESLLKNSYTLLYACPENSPLMEMAASHGIPLMKIPKSLFWQFITLRAYLKKTRTTTLHVLDKNALKLAKYLKMSMRQSLKIVASHHEPTDITSLEPFSSPNDYAIQALLAKKVHLLMISSPELFNTLEKQEIAPNSLGLLPYSVDLEDVFPKETLVQNLSKTDPNQRFAFFLDIPLEAYSGVEVLFEALVNLKEYLTTKDPVIEVHICGTGSLISELIDKAHELDIASMLAFFGNNDSQIFYKNSHALICPSIEGEGDYRTIINGWRASLPAIVSDLSVHTKLVLSGRNNHSALIFPRDSAETLAQCMLQLIRNESVRAEICATGKTMLPVSRYEELGSKYLKLLRKV